MMQTKIFSARLGGTAIAAVLALSATPAFAQEVTPQVVPQATTPAPTASTPTTTTTTTTTTTAPEATEPAADPLAAAPADEVAPAATTTKATTAKKVSKPVAAKPAAKSTSVATKSIAPAVATAPAFPAPTEPVPATDVLPTAPLAAAPPPAPEPVAAPVANNVPDETLPIALGAGLGLLALGGAAFALRRRRRNVIAEDALILDEPTIARRPVEPIAATPAVAERSAFSWGAPAAATVASTPARGRTWVERAHDGPTPENPFLNLKKRLQRAAFYDQRERAVAEGSAKPLSPMAGLPSRFAAAIKPKAPATRAPSYGFSYAPA